VFTLFEQALNRINESLRWPVSIRTVKYLSLFNIHKNNIQLVKKCEELWKKIEADPNNVKELTIFNIGVVGSDRDGRKLKFYSLHINPPGQAQFRAIAFEPREREGIIIWIWFGTHEEYNKEYLRIINHIPSEWVNRNRNGLNFMGDRAAAARLENLPHTQDKENSIKRQQKEKEDREKKDAWKDLAWAKKNLPVRVTQDLTPVTR